MSMNTCRYCGCSFKDGKGVNSKGKKYTTVGLIFNICMLGLPIICGVPTLQKYCSRQCWQSDRG